MKNKRLISILMMLAVMMSMLLASCESKPKTLEEFVNNDEEAMEDIQETADESGLKVEIKENDVIYSYDISDYEGMTEEIAKGDQMIKALDAALDDAGETFTDLCKDLEEESGIEGVRIMVNYTYKDDELVSKTYDKSGIADSGSAADKEEAADDEDSGEE